MSCEGVLGSMVALLDGELPADERRTVERHVDVCDGCRNELELLAATRVLVTRQLASVASAAPKPSFEAVWRRVDGLADDGPRWAAVARSGGSAPRAPRSRPVGAPNGAGRRRLSVWGGAAGLAVAASLALLIVARQGEQVPPVPKPAAPALGANAAAQVASPARKSELGRRESTRPATDGEKELESNPVPVDDEKTPEGEVLTNEVDPPRELLERPELFINYPIVRRLDELRHLESVLADSADAGRAG